MGGGDRTPRLTSDAPEAPPSPSGAPAAASPAIALRRELARKALHLTTAVVPLAYAAGLPRPALIGALATLLLVAAGVEWARRRSSAVRERFTRLAGPLLREHEHTGAAGATWLLAGYLLAVVVAPAPAAITAMWAVAVGDSTAAIAGRARAAARVRRAAAAPPHAPPAPRGKTLLGSAAMLAVTLLGALLVARLTWGAALLASVAATAAERPARPLDDNLRIVLAVLLALAAVALATP